MNCAQDDTSKLKTFRSQSGQIPVLHKLQEGFVYLPKVGAQLFERDQTYVLAEVVDLEKFCLLIAAVVAVLETRLDGAHEGVGGEEVRAELVILGGIFRGDVPQLNEAEEASADGGDAGQVYAAEVGRADCFEIRQRGAEGDGRRGRRGGGGGDVEAGEEGRPLNAVDEGTAVSGAALFLLLLLFCGFCALFVDAFSKGAGGGQTLLKSKH